MTSDAYLSIRISRGLKGLLEQLARNERRKTSQFVAILIEKDIEREYPNEFREFMKTETKNNRSLIRKARAIAASRK